MKYSVEPSFSFEIERYKNKTSNEYITLDKLNGNEELYEYTTINLDIEGKFFFCSGKLSGPPEDCYPSESDTEIISVIDDDGNDWYNLLTENEVNNILMEIERNAEE